MAEGGISSPRVIFARVCVFWLLVSKISKQSARGEASPYEMNPRAEPPRTSIPPPPPGRLVAAF